MLRCGAVVWRNSAGQDETAGEWLTINYYDEDGTTVSERFRLTTPAQRFVFEKQFLAQHLRHPVRSFQWQDAESVIRQQVLLRYPDFVVSRKKRTTGKSAKKSLIIRGDSANLTVWHNPECCFLVLYRVSFAVCPHFR